MLPYHNVFVVLIALRHVGSIQTSKFIFQSFYNTYSKKNPPKPENKNKQNKTPTNQKEKTKLTKNPQRNRTKKGEEKQLI